jgi:hypothetical protein
MTREYGGYLLPYGAGEAFVRAGRADGILERTAKVVWIWVSNVSSLRSRSPVVSYCRFWQLPWKKLSVQTKKWPDPRLVYWVSIYLVQS